MDCLQGVLGLIIPLGGLTEHNTGVWENLLAQEKCELKQAHPVCSRQRWIYGRGVSGVAEELPSLTAQNGTCFERKI